MLTLSLSLTLSSLHIQESLAEVDAHQDEADFITNTVPFLVEHSRKAVREEIRLRAEEHSQRYLQLKEFLGGYVGNLKDSIPFWQEFNKQTEDLGQWLRHANEELESDRTQPGNATVTESSLRNTHVLQEDIEGHRDFFDDAMKTGNTLKRLVGDEDQQFIAELLERLKFGTQEVEQEAEERVEQLEERYKSWRVSCSSYYSITSCDTLRLEIVSCCLRNSLYRQIASYMY